MIQTPDFDTKCPIIPERASRYEEQEIARHWRNVFHCLSDVVDRCESVASALTPEAALKAVVARGYSVPDPLSLANASMSLAQAAAELSALQAAINGVIHRQALGDKS